MTDDHGPWAMHNAGCHELHTPSMDWIATTGARFTQATTPCPVCSPARASFHTGSIPSHHGIHDYLQEPELVGDHPGLSGQLTIAQLLKANGYRTGLCGKWHCGEPEVPQPGFDEWFTMSKGTNAKFGRQPFCHNGKAVEMHGQQAPMITDQAVNFLRDAAENDMPFFLYVGYTDTHSPFATLPERLVERYRYATFDDIPREKPDDRHALVRWPADNEAEFREKNAQYYASVTHIDEQVGRLLDELESQGNLENTLVIYTSDHGHNNGHHGFFTKGNCTVPQNFYDESIGVPLVMRWPGQIKPGTVRPEPVDHCDLFATVLDAARVELSDEERKTLNSPGRSMLDLLMRDGVKDWRDAQFCEYGNARMIRTREAKLIRRYPGPNGHFRDEYFDLTRDPREHHNAIDDPAYAEAIDKLSKKLDDYFARYENPEKSGVNIALQPKCNNHHPWETAV